ncbi:MAG: iron-sulfur cluster repair di-iron protein [bacterium]
MNNTIDFNLTVGEIVAERIGRSRVLESYGLDYCCGGGTPFADACAAKGLDPDEVAAAIAESDAAPAAGEDDGADYRSMPLSRLCDHIEETHHVFMKREVPRLTELLDKTFKAHGENHPELAQVVRVYAGLRAEIEAHLLKEEQVLFPFIRQMEATGGVPQFHCGSLQAPIGVMLQEHDNAGDALRKLSELTNGYAVPEDACSTYRAALDGLREMELDLHLHIHKENNILFPRALEEEQIRYETAAG